jgi:phosphopantothenoylcysteine decarboxylase/phosphopantothenate--cysteine ligase
MQTQDDNRPRILLGVSGGIAAYKSPELVRRLVERGADVQVVMTRGAREFVSPLTFQAVSGRPVRDDIWDAEAEDAMGHIALARWADLLLVAPATAHAIGALANGLAGDLLGTVYLATTAPTWIAPAMNHAMWAHEAVQTNVRALEHRGVRVLGPGVGDQACGEHGPGRMLEPEDIAAAVFETPATLASQALKGVRVLVTAGPTREPIDPVRYVTNRSSGKMGYALAQAARQAGADVTLVSGPVTLGVPPGVSHVGVETAEEMYSAVHERIDTADLFIGCAAVSDYRPASQSPQKIKRKDEEMSLALIRSKDTLASVAKLAGGPFTVGFAAETDNVVEHARQKLENKGVDMMAANRVGPDCGFDQDTNALTVLWRGGEQTLEQAPKPVLARRLIALIAERFRHARDDRDHSTNANAPA